MTPLRPLALLVAAALFASSDVPRGWSGVPPLLPLGYDAYLDWDRWPVLRINQRTIMRATFDRLGGNHSADASHFLHEDDHGYVPLDLAGSGVLSFVRHNHWHGSPWRYLADGHATIVTETSTADPDHGVPDAIWLPPDLFPSPLAVTWWTTKGADLSWTRIPFTSSFSISYGRTHYGTGYFIVQTVPEQASNLTAPLETYAQKPPPEAVLDLFTRAGEDQAPRDGLIERGGRVFTNRGIATELTTIVGGGTMRALKLTIPAENAKAAARSRLRITWDDRDAPSVDAPLGLFFGSGSFHNREHKEWLVKAFPVSVRFPPGSTDIELATYFPMPFGHRAKIEIVSPWQFDVRWSLRWLPKKPREAYGYLHATYRDHWGPENTVHGKDLVFVDTQGAEGEKEWCGTVVGTSVIFSDYANLGTLEGDPRFFFDDNKTPQVQGTGTEEWGGGGDYWGGLTMTLPFAGHPTGAPTFEKAENDEDKIEGLYRFLLGDAMPFGRRAIVGLEHGGLDESLEHYQSVAYWYGWPEACLVPADAIDVGDVADESRHRYVAAGGSAVAKVKSRYEVGVDVAGATVVNPEIEEDGRQVSGSSEMTVTIPPANLGLLVRRTHDYAVADQTADVYLAPVDAQGTTGAYRRVGTWLNAGSNRVVFSNPKPELGAPEPVIETSERRLRDDEFLIDRRFTEGLSRVRLRFVVKSHGTPMRKGDPIPPALWSELRYAIYAWRMPLTSNQ